MLEADSEAAHMSGVSRSRPELSGSAGASIEGEAPPARDVAAWVRGLLAAHFDFIWRSLRRLGVPEGDLDDAAQRVFCVASRRATDVADGSERSFLFSTAMHVAADYRRARARVREVSDDEALEQAEHPMSNPEELADQRRARRMLDAALDAMPIDLRVVFVLFELEEVTAPEIAVLLGLPVGTVSSRLRRAREEFRSIVTRMRKGMSGGLRPDDAPSLPRGGRR